MARRERTEPNKWETHDPCEKCGKPYDEHTFRASVACIYGGLPLKDGGVFTRATADEIVDRVADRLADDFGLEGGEDG